MDIHCMSMAIFNFPIEQEQELELGLELGLELRLELEQSE